MEMTVRYGYVANIGSFVWALITWASGWQGAFDWAQVMGKLDRG